MFGFFKNTGVEDAYIWAYEENVSAGFIPTNDAAVCVFTGSHQQRFKQEIQRDIAAGFYAVLGEAAPEFADRIKEENQVEHFRGFPGIIGYYRRPLGRRLGPGRRRRLLQGSHHRHTESPMPCRDAELLTRALTTSARGSVEEKSKPWRNTNGFGTRYPTISSMSQRRWPPTPGHSTTSGSTSSDLSKAMAPEVELIKTFGPV